MQVAGCGLENEGKCGAGGSASNTLSDLKAAPFTRGLGPTWTNYPGRGCPVPSSWPGHTLPSSQGEAPLQFLCLPACPRAASASLLGKLTPLVKVEKPSEGRGLFFLLFFSQLTVVCICSAMFYEKHPKFWSSVALLTGTDPARTITLFHFGADVYMSQPGILSSPSPGSWLRPWALGLDCPPASSQLPHLQPLLLQSIPHHVSTPLPLP